VDNIRKNTALMQIYNGLTVQIQKKFADRDIKSEPKITNWRSVFEEISAKTFPTCMEDVLDKALKNKEIPFSDNLSRIRDYFMLKWQVPIICFSLDNIYGDIHLDYDTKNIFYRDQGGILTKKWNSIQLERGSLHNETTNVVFIIENLGILPEEDLKEKMHELASLVQKYCGGSEFEEDIVKHPRKEKDLGVIGLQEFEGADEEEEEMGFSEEEIQKEKEQKPEKESEPESKPEATPQSELESQQETQKKTEFFESIDKNSLKARLRVMFLEACEKAYPEADVSSLNVEYPRDSEHGDYACSIAMKLAKQLVKEPIKIAEKIIQNIEPIQFVGSMEAVMPGFINIKIARHYLESKIKDFAEDTPLYDNTLGGNNAIVVDYSHPNIAKPLGVHHLLSTIIGQSVYNIYKSLGFQCVSVNHLGDWGTQFGKLIYAYNHWGKKKAVEKDPIPELLKLYVRFHEEAEQDNSLEDRAREEFKKLEEGNKENLELWQWFKDLSLVEIQKIYKILNIEFDEYLGESFYNDKMAPIIDEGLQKNIFKEGEEGALIVEFKDEKLPPAVVRKSDGTTLYLTRDIATLAYRIKRWDPKQILYVVDDAQSLHFKQLFETGEMLGLTSAKLVHINFGRMRLPDKSMSTRKGNVVLLEELINQGLEKASKIIQEKSKDLNKKEKEAVSNMVAIGAIKYNTLSQNRTTEMTFEWDKMLSVEGNSAPYLQYTVARAESILRKYNEMTREGKKSGSKKGDKDAPEENPQTDLFEALERTEGYSDNMKPFEHPLEQAVARMLVKFQEYLVLAAEEYKPNLLANYLYDLAQEFNSFYNAVSVLQADSTHVRLARLNITKSVARIITEGLKILGIEVPERM
jgi:arginyl-tRNA synthetase